MVRDCRGCSGPLSTVVAVEEEFTEQGVTAGAECAACGTLAPAGPAIPAEIRRWTRRRLALVRQRAAA